VRVGLEVGPTVGHCVGAIDGADVCALTTFPLQENHSLRGPIRQNDSEDGLNTTTRTTQVGAEVQQC
jgi:hypothetical protein